MLCILGAGGTQTAGSVPCLLNPYCHSASLQSRRIAVQKKQFTKSFKLFGLKSTWFAFHFMPWFQSPVWAKNRDRNVKYAGILFIPLISLLAYNRECLPTKYLFHISETSFVLPRVVFSDYDSTIKVHWTDSSWLMVEQMMPTAQLILDSITGYLYKMFKAFEWLVYSPLFKIQFYTRQPLGVSVTI